MPIFLPVGFKLMSAEILFAPLTTDVTLILQFIPQPKEAGEFLFFYKVCPQSRKDCRSYSSLLPCFIPPGFYPVNHALQKAHDIFTVLTYSAKTIHQSKKALTIIV